MTRHALASIVVLVVMNGYQWRSLRAMKAEIETLRSGVTTRTRQVIVEQFDEAHHAEMQRAVAWLNDFYGAPEGLHRTQGLCHDGKLDGEGLVVWLFDSYLRLRVDGNPEGLARQTVADSIKQSGEWRAAHAR